MVYKKDVEDLNQTMAERSNNSIIPYEGLDVLHHKSWMVVAEFNKVKQSHDDYDGIGPSGEGNSNDVPEVMAHGDLDCEE